MGEAREIRGDCGTALLASFLINAWEGAILRSKVVKNSAPLEEFNQIVFGKLLASTEERP